MMAAASTAVAMGRLSASPPSLTGLSRKSPKVAPNGRVRMNAAQNSDDARNARPEVQRRDQRQGRAEDQRAAEISESRVIRHPIAEGGAERLRECDRRPVEGLRLRAVRGWPPTPCPAIDTITPACRERRSAAASSRRDTRCRASGRRSRPSSCRQWSRPRSSTNTRRDGNDRARIWKATSTMSNDRKIAVPARYPSFIVIVTVSPPVSPSVVARILITQKPRVTAGTLADGGTECSRRSFIICPAILHRSCAARGVQVRNLVNAPASASFPRFSPRGCRWRTAS